MSHSKAAFEEKYTLKPVSNPMAHSGYFTVGLKRKAPQKRTIVFVGTVGPRLRTPISQKHVGYNIEGTAIPELRSPISHN